MQLLSQFQRNHETLKRHFLHTDNHHLQDHQREQLAVTLCIAVIGIGFGVASGSFSIVFDGVYVLLVILSIMRQLNRFLK